MNITIIGAGAFGTALGRVLESKQHHITYYSRRLKITLKQALNGAEMLLLAVPSKAIPDILPELPTNIPLIIATKGILDIDKFKNFNGIMVVSGPGFANDINHHQKTKLTTTDPRIRDLFETDWLRFDMTSDEKGVLMCGALKNVYAIYAGLKNLQPHTESHKKYLLATIEEMKADLMENGANPKTVNLACGQGDLKITCGYPSRNYEFGQRLIKNINYQPEKTVEGVTALKEIKAGAIKVPKTAFILKELIEISNSWA